MPPVVENDAAILLQRLDEGLAATDHDKPFARFSERSGTECYADIQSRFL
jgi:hypothetical protein